MEHNVGHEFTGHELDDVCELVTGREQWLQRASRVAWGTCIMPECERDVRLRSVMVGTHAPLYTPVGRRVRRRVPDWREAIKAFISFTTSLATIGAALGVAIAAGAGNASAGVAVRGTYTPIDPVRIVDTRDGTGVAGQHAGPLGAGQVTQFVVTGVGGVPATGVGAVVLNIIATEAAEPGSITVYPCGEGFFALAS